jgi:hypothetical protein
MVINLKNAMAAQEQGPKAKLENLDASVAVHGTRAPAPESTGASIARPPQTQRREDGPEADSRVQQTSTGVDSTQSFSAGQPSGGFVPSSVPNCRAGASQSCRR